MGLQYARTHDYTKSETEFNLLLSDDRTHALGFYYRGCTRLKLNKFELAVKDFDSAILSLNLPPEFELLPLYKRGFAYQKLCQFDAALDNYLQFLNGMKEKGKNDLIHKAYFSIGNVYAALNQNEQAVHHFDNAILKSRGSIEDDQKVYYLHRGRARAFCADFEAAQKDLHVVIHESNDSFVKGCAHNELGQHNKALQEFNLWLENKSKNDPKSSLSVEILDEHVQFRRGLSYASLKHHDDALADYQRIIDNSNRSTSLTIADRIFFRKGTSSMALDDANYALINFNKSISLNNRQADVFYARGMLHFTLGRYDAAVYDHRHALELRETNPTLPSIYQTFYHTHNYGRDNINHRLSHQKQLHEAEATLRYCKEQGLNPEEQHRRIAEYKQQLAPYIHDPEKTHRSAREHIQKAITSSTNMKTYDNITLAINDLCAAQMLCDKYPAGISNERIVNQFVSLTMNGILKMSEVLEKCAVEKNWNTLLNALHELYDMSHTTNSGNSFNLFRLNFVRIELNKAKMMQKTSEKFEKSSQQHEFYTMLMIRLCNLFDATRTATTGIFQHALTGTFTNVSYAAQLLGYLSNFLPMGGGVAQNIFSICATGAKNLDEIRIQNALTCVGCLGDQKELNKAADTIAEKLTIMYEQQIQRFPTTKDDSNIKKKNDENKRNCCTKCCQWCCNCLKKSKNRIFNEGEASNMQCIVQYASDLLINSLTELEVSKVNDIADLNDYFVRSICRLDYLPNIYRHITMTKIQPKDATNDKGYWDTYEFFRGPAIRFGENDIRADKHMNINKFSYREPSWEEVSWYKNDLKKLDDWGLQKIPEN
jgi:tetratricopeptide (TPR) repeat protein